MLLRQLPEEFFVGSGVNILPVKMARAPPRVGAGAFFVEGVLDKEREMCV